MNHKTNNIFHIPLPIFGCTKLQFCFDSMKFFSIDFHRIRHMDGTTKHLYPIASQKSSNCLCKDKQERAESIPELLGINIRQTFVSLLRQNKQLFVFNIPPIPQTADQAADLSYTS